MEYNNPTAHNYEQFLPHSRSDKYKIVINNANICRLFYKEASASIPFLNRF